MKRNKKTGKVRKGKVAFQSTFLFLYNLAKLFIWLAYHLTIFLIHFVHVVLSGMIFSLSCLNKTLALILQGKFSVKKACQAYKKSYKSLVKA